MLDVVPCLGRSGGLVTVRAVEKNSRNSAQNRRICPWGRPLTAHETSETKSVKKTRYQATPRGRRHPRWPTALGGPEQRVVVVVLALSAPKSSNPTSAPILLVSGQPPNAC